MTQAFCGDCNRARLSTEGRLYLCLFAGQGHDLRTPRSAAAPATTTSLGDRRDLARPNRPLFGTARHPWRLTPGGGARRVEMSYIGG